MGIESPHVKRALNRWECWAVPPPTHHLGPQPRGLLPNCLNTRYCLGIHVTITKETGVQYSSLSHAWTAPSVEEMLCYARTGLTKAMVTVPGRAVLFYRRHSLGEGLSPDESRDAAFVLTGVGIWVGKPAYLAAEPLTIQEGQQEIAWAVTRMPDKGEGPRASACESCQPHNHSDLTNGEILAKRTPLKGCQFRP